jgi:hypothetical protein
MSPAAFLQRVRQLCAGATASIVTILEKQMRSVTLV